MPKHLTISLPAGDPALRRELELGVEEYADLLPAQSYADMETVKLVLDIVGEAVGIAGGVAGILAFIRSLKAEREAQGQVVNIFIGVQGGPQVPLDQADAELLTSLLQEDV